MTKPKPLPEIAICRQTPKVWECVPGYWVVTCSKCGAQGPVCKTELGAIVGWNKRVEGKG